MNENAKPKTRKEIAEFGKEVKKVAARRMSVLEHTIEILKQKLEEYRYIDVSKYAASAIGVSEATLMRAIVNLELSNVAQRFYIPLEQKFTDKKVTLRVLAPKGTHFVEIMKVRHGGIHHIATHPENRQSIIEQRNLIAIAKGEEARGKIWRTRQMKTHGYSNVAIGEALGVSESTVRRYLKKPKESEELLVDGMLEDLEVVRTELIEKLTNHPEFTKVFGDRYILNVSPKRREGSVDVKEKRAEFMLSFTVTVKDAY